MFPEQVTLSACVEIIPVVMSCHVSQHAARIGDTVCVCRDYSSCHVMSPNMSEQVTLCVCVEIIPIVMLCHVSQHAARTGDTVCVEIIPVVMLCHVSQHAARTGYTVCVCRDHSCCHGMSCLPTCCQNRWHCACVCVCVEIIPVFMACHVSQHVARTGDTVCV